MLDLQLLNLNLRKSSKISSSIMPYILLKKINLIISSHGIALFLILIMDSNKINFYSCIFVYITIKESLN